MMPSRKRFTHEANEAEIRRRAEAGFSSSSVAILKLLDSHQAECDQYAENAKQLLAELREHAACAKRLAAAGQERDEAVKSREYADEARDHWIKRAEAAECRLADCIERESARPLVVDAYRQRAESLERRLAAALEALRAISRLSSADKYTAWRIASEALATARAESPP